MYLKDIKNHKWNVINSLEVVKNYGSSLPVQEQELIINSQRSGMRESTREIYVDCSDQTIITTLAKSEYFTVEQVIIAEKNEFIIAVKGILDNKGLTIRKKRPVFSSSERQNRKLRLQALHNHHKKKIVERTGSLIDVERKNEELDAQQ